MTSEPSAVRRVVWTEIAPWLLLFRTFRVARRIRLLVWAASGILVMAGGWALLDALFPGVDAVITGSSAGGGAPSLGLDALVPDRPTWDIFQPYRQWRASPNPPLLDRLPDPVVGTWEQFSRPLLRLLTAKSNFQEIAFYILAGIWAIAVWGYFGGAMCRTAALALSRDEYISFGDCLVHARRKWLSHLGAPLIPLGVAVLFVIGLAIVGLFLRSDWGTLVMAILWPVVLLSGFAIVLLGIGVLFGWPLMWGTLATENADAFDAVSRSFAYLFQRPLHYLFYAVVASIFGLLAWFAVANIAAATIWMTHWAVDWGADLTRWTTAEVPLRRDVGSILLGTPELTPIGWIGSNLLGFWKALVKLIAISFLYSYFWTAACACYLLLRRDVDATEIEEIYLGDRPTVPLPELKPEIQAKVAPPPAASSTPVPPPPPPPVTPPPPVAEGPSA